MTLPTCESKNLAWVIKMNNNNNKDSTVFNNFHSPSQIRSRQRMVYPCYERSVWAWWKHGRGGCSIQHHEAYRWRWETSQIKSIKFNRSQCFWASNKYSIRNRKVVSNLAVPLIRVFQVKFSKGPRKMVPLTTSLTYFQEMLNFFSNFF